MAKLSSLSLHPLILSWICSFLTNRSQYTVINNHPSTVTKVTSGVPQGSVLGPLLFLVFINDLPVGISSSIRLFADDCVLYRRVSTTNDQSLLQDDLNLIQSWCSTWLMKLNETKCKFMHVSRKRSNLHFSYTLNRTALSEVESYRYLGIEITSDLNWSKHITSLAASVSKSLGFIRRSLTFSPPKVRLIAYETFIRTKLEYASSIWNPHQKYLTHMLEAIQNRAARFIISNYDSRSSVTNIKSSVGLPSLASRRKIARLCLFHKLYYNFPQLRESLIMPPLRSSRRLYNCRSIQRIHGSTNAFNSSFLPAAIAEWNVLPDSVVNEVNSLKFKQMLIDLFPN